MVKQTIWEKYGEGVVWQLMQCDFSGEVNMNRPESVQRYAFSKGFLKLAAWLADKPARYADFYTEFCQAFNPRWVDCAAPNDSGSAATTGNRFGIRDYPLELGHK